jgi:hypothetical protein
MIYVVLWVLLLLMAVPALAGNTTNTRGTTDTWANMTSTISNGAGFLSGAITVTSAGYQLAECELFAASFSGNVVAQGSISLWVCREVDGTNYEDCDTANFSPRRPDAVFPLRSGAATVQRVSQVIVMPPGSPKALVRNESGVSLNATSTIKCKPYTPTQP